LPFIRFPAKNLQSEHFAANTKNLACQLGLFFCVNIVAKRDTPLAFAIFCSKCDQFKDYSLFSQVSKKSLRPAFSCNDCKREYHKAYSEAHKGQPRGRKKPKRTKEERRQQIRDYYWQNKESISQYALQYREQNKEKLMLYALTKKRSVSADSSLWKEWRLTQILGSAKHRAKCQNLDFNLTMDFLMSIASDNCPVDSLPMDWSVDENKKLQPMPRTPSIDKIVPSLGYVEGNVQIICWQYNAWKRDMSIHDMRILLSYLRKEQK
jgi:hypothetical protein